MTTTRNYAGISTTSTRSIPIRLPPRLLSRPRWHRSGVPFIGRKSEHSYLREEESYLMQYDFVFSTEERESLVRTFNTVPSNPYSAYESFMDGIRALISDSRVPHRFVEFCAETKARDLEREPIVVIGNCPIDETLPVFDAEDPVRSKYQLKKTFVAEGFLALYALLTGTVPIAHKSVNGGDFFHDIYPKKSMYESQSQKTLETLRF